MPGFITRVGVSEVVFPWGIPNINNKSSEITIRIIPTAGDLPTDYLISIPIGFATPSAIAAYITLAVHALPGNPIPNFEMLYGTGNQPYFTYSADSTGVSTASVSFQPLPYNSAAYPYASTSKQLFDVLGFTDANKIEAEEGTGLYTFAQSIRYVDIVCNQLTNSQSQKDQTSQTVARDMLCRIYVGDAGPGTNMGGAPAGQPSSNNFAPPGSLPTVIYRNFTMPKQIQWIPNQNIPGFLQFQVYDDTGDLLDNSLIGVYNAGSAPAFSSHFGYGFDWSMTLLVSEN